MVPLEDLKGSNILVSRIRSKLIHFYFIINHFNYKQTCMVLNRVAVYVVFKQSNIILVLYAMYLPAIASCAMQTIQTPQLHPTIRCRLQPNK